MKFPKRPYPRRAETRMGNMQSTCQLGHSHRSKLEAAICQMIMLRERAGELKLDQVEDHVYLSEARIAYVPDFRCIDTKTGEQFWIEAKGFANDRWPILLKLWRIYGPGKLEVWKGTHQRPVLDEIVTPKRGISTYD